MWENENGQKKESDTARKGAPCVFKNKERHEKKSRKTALRN